MLNSASRTPGPAGPRAALLQEAKLLEEMGGEWGPEHVEAFTGYSISYVRRSTCPKILKHGQGAQDRGAVRYLPADVKAWLAAQTKERVA